MAENKMEQVAVMFGKKLGEEFKIKWEYLGINIYDCRFEENGLFTHYEEEYDDVYEDNDLLKMLLTGEAVIVDE